MKPCAKLSNGDNTASKLLTEDSLYVNLNKLLQLLSIRWPCTLTRIQNISWHLWAKVKRRSNGTLRRKTASRSKTSRGEEKLTHLVLRVSVTSLAILFAVGPQSSNLYFNFSDMRPDLEFNKNEDQFKQLVQELHRKSKKLKLGGGDKKIDEQHQKGKLTARERIDYLTDKGSSFLEIGVFAGEGMYKEQGGCPSGGVVTGIGYVAGRQCVIVANDATVKAGAWFPITAKKNLRAQEIAMENRLPIIYLVDSAGVFLPMQDEIFPDKEHFGRQFRNNAKMSAMGIIQIAAIMGSCVAGGAYLPIMSDEAMIVDKTGSIFLAGSYLVKAAIGESIDNETLGGATTHCEISGVTDNKFPNDQACLDYIRGLFEKFGNHTAAGFDRSAPKLPQEKEDEIYGIVPADRVKPYDTLEIIKRIVDGSEFQEYKASLW